MAMLIGSILVVIQIDHVAAQADDNKYPSFHAINISSSPIFSLISSSEDGFKFFFFL